MPSTNNTEHLGLSLWQGTDKPKMEDFNADNRALDSALGGHLAAGTLHLNAEDREKWDKAAPLIGSYLGDDEEIRGLTLAFMPSFGIIFRVDKNIVQSIGTTGNMMVYSAFISEKGCSQGAFVEDGVLYVMQSASAMENRIPQLNQLGGVYVYALFR